MTSVDILIVAILLLTTQLGIRIGLARQLGVTVGLFTGLFAAASMQWQFIVLTTAAGNQVSDFYFWLIIALALTIALCVNGGFAAGAWLHKRFQTVKRAKRIDTVGGAILAGVTTVIAIWLSSTLILRSPSPFFASQVRGSFIINSLKQTFPQAPEVFARAGTLLDPNALPAVFAGSEPPIAAASPTTPDIPHGLRQTAAQAAPSVVKITAHGCGGVSTGSGFVVADNVVVTNAHVIAGVSTPYIVDRVGQHPAKTILFDPQLDLAILRTTGLEGQPLALNVSAAQNGSSGVSLGYATGQLLASGATVLARQNATGYDIYDVKLVTRTIYALNTIIEQGDSGGPVISSDGQVIGMIFAKSTSKPNVGYALTADQIDAQLKTALAKNQTVSNGQCGKE